MQEALIEGNPLLKKSIAFTLNIIEYCELLNVNKKYIVSKQLFRAASSIGANAFESQNAESKADFIHKIKISAKEADETQYWLIVCNTANDYPKPIDLMEQLYEIQRIINSILKTSKSNMKVN